MKAGNEGGGADAIATAAKAKDAGNAAFKLGV